uniref:Uncharacterized protein n=1 Tax=viral metagenome TaxID=1070528 RepID=A0A6C0HTD0_9ZZZZ
MASSTLSRTSSTLLRTSSEPVFSRHNAPFIMGRTEDLPASVSEFPPRIRRSTHEWSNYFGQYPSACAEIIGEENFRSRIGRTGEYTTRHVLQMAVNSRDLHLSPTPDEVGVVQREVRDMVRRIYTQLELFGDIGLVWKKTTGGAELMYENDVVTLRFLLVEETSMFQVIIRKQTRYLMGTVVYPDMENLSSLIYCLRMIFITPGFFAGFNFEINAEDIQRASSVTFELSLVPPKELEELESMSDDGEWHMDADR